MRDTVLFLSLPCSLLLNLAAWLHPIPPWLAVFLIPLMIGGTLSQYAHGSLHRESNPFWITVLRHSGLLMTPEAHSLNHATLDRDFATLNGWSNRLVNVVFKVALRLRIITASGLEPQ